jgi:hypothetical protein
VARQPARIPCSVGSDRTARASADRRTGRRRWDPPCTVPGQTAPDRKGLAPSARAGRDPARAGRDPARAGRDPARAGRDLPRLGTGPGRSQPARAQDPVARIPAGLAVAMVAPAPGGCPAPGLVPGRRLPSRARTGQPTAAAPRTVPGRLDQVRAVPDPTTPDPAGSPAPAQAGPVPGLGSLVPDTPGPAGNPDVLAPDTPDVLAPSNPGVLAPSNQARGVRHPGRRARPVPVLARRRTAQGRADRRGPRAAGRAAARSAAALALGQGHRAGDAGPQDVAEGGLRPAWRPRDAARAGQPTPGRTPPAS